MVFAYARRSQIEWTWRESKNAFGDGKSAGLDVRAAREIAGTIRHTGQTLWKDLQQGCVGRACEAPAPVRSQDGAIGDANSSRWYRDGSCRCAEECPRRLGAVRRPFGHVWGGGGNGCEVDIPIGSDRNGFPALIVYAAPCSGVCRSP